MPHQTILLDTHILLWILTESKKLKALEWLKKPYSWAVSPITLLEIKFLQECSRLALDFEKVLVHLKKDERFFIDDLSLIELMTASFDLSWTRDPFDRLLVAHSMVRRWPLATCDRQIRENHHRIL